MSQIETKPWVIITVFKDEVNPSDIERIAPQIQSLTDDWQSAGKIMWSGPFNDDVTGMAVFEATKKEADYFFKKYDQICSGILNYSMYEWDAMPILSVLSDKQVGVLFLFKMNNKLCRICGCEIKELDFCIQCRLKVTAICNCCQNVVDIQTHVNGVCNGL